MPALLTTGCSVGLELYRSIHHMPALLTTGCLSTYLEAYCLERYAANHTEEFRQKIFCNPAVGRDGRNRENEGGKGMKYERRREERLKEEGRKG